MFKKNIDGPQLKVVADGIISNPLFAEGRPLPVLIIDATSIPVIKEYIAAHHLHPPGDVLLHWGSQRFSTKFVALQINLSRPVETCFSILFNVEKQHTLVDAILHVRGFYLQVGDSNTKTSETFLEPKIIIEVPDMGFMPKWEKIIYRVLTAHFRENGFSRNEAITAVTKYLKTMREFWAIRRKPHAKI